MYKIEQQAIETYTKNLEYLEQNHPEVFEKVNILSKSIEQGLYKEQYALEYKDDSYFDLINLETNSMYYGTNTSDLAIQQAALINNTNQYSFNLLHRYPDRYLKIPYTDIAQTNIESLNHFYSYIYKHMKNFDFTKIEKFIFIGSGLGTHILEIDKKIQARVYMIIEPNLEIFRLSLFTTKFYDFNTKQNIIFSIADNQEEFEYSFTKFSLEASMYNYGIKFDLLQLNYDYILKDLINYFTRQKPTNYPYSHVLKGIERCADYINEDYRFLKLNEKIKTIENYPVLIIAPGPSATRYIKWLEINQNKFIIVSLAASLKMLSKYNINPDIVVSLDAQDLVLNQYDFENKDILNNAIHLFGNQTAKIVSDQFDKDKIFIFQIIQNLIPKIGYLSFGHSIGEITYALSMTLGAKNIYLLGTDMAIDQETGATHDTTHISSQNNIGKITIDENISLINNTRDELIEVKGNKKDIVKTTRQFFYLLTFYNRYTKLLKTDDINIYNISDGVYINDTIPIETLEIDNINLPNIDKRLLTQELLSEFKTISTYGKDIIQESDIDNDIDLLKKIIKKIKKSKKIKFKTYQDFMYDKFTIQIDILTITKDLVYKENTNTLMTSFLYLTDIYMSKFFSDISKQKDKKSINILYNYWLDILDQIMNKWIEILRKLK